MRMDLVKTFLKEIYDGKFKDKNNKISKKIECDYRFPITKDWLYKVYVNLGQGFKSIIKDYGLEVSYSFLRNFVRYLEFPIHSNKIANDFLKNRRSQIAKENFKNKTGFFKDGIQASIHHKSQARGIQGYYWNCSMNKYVWLRSSWEFIYAKWLNRHKNIVWDVEFMEYKLSDGTYYRPDFFIFGDNNELIRIVEIKGYWKNRAYKVKLLEKEYGIESIMIDDIRPYTENGINQEISIWKHLRKLKLNE